MAKRVQDIYVRDRQVVHQKYRQKHLAQMQVAQSYEQVKMYKDFTNYVFITFWHSPSRAVCARAYHGIGADIFFTAILRLMPLIFVLQRVAEEEKRRAAREAEILRMEKEEAELLERLKNAQVCNARHARTGALGLCLSVSAAGAATERVCRARGGTGRLRLAARLLRRLAAFPVSCTQRFSLTPHERITSN